VILLAAVLAAGIAPQPPADRADDPPSMFGRPPESRSDEVRRLQQQFDDAFRRSDLPAAEAALRRLADLDRRNFVPPYNLACVLAMQGKTDQATAALQLAVQRGFSDLRHLQADPHLASIRSTEVYRGLVDSWDQILEKRAELNLEAARETFGPRYTYSADPAMRLQYVAAADPVSFERAQREIERCAAWWAQAVMARRADPVVAHGSGAPDERSPDARGAGRDPWVMVILPTREDYQTWARNRYGEGWMRVGGAYSDDEKTLVAQDLGPTLRHEFWHVLHWRDMRRLGQMHPTWIMEGLCSLPEDVEAGPAGEMRVLPSWRTNIAKRRLEGGALAPWDVLFSLRHDRFVTSSPLGRYAEARTIFHFLFDQGRLADWYDAYVRGYGEDSTGRAAFEKVFGKPLAQVEKDYRAWLRALPRAPEEIPIGGATLPFAFEVGGQDGVLVRSVVSASGRAGDRPGLKLGDVITRIDGQSVYEMGELVRILSRFEPGQEVEVEYRRGRLSGTATVVLGRHR
jgi:hypothetical protein